jgi:glyoxylase-like metal-dependent hydrolase (beta-lactamase superfamily II)
MSLVIHPLLLAEGETDASFVVWGDRPGERAKIVVTAYLILGGGAPILVDAGMRVPGGRLEEGFFLFTQTSEQTLAARLAEHGLEPKDIGTLVFTHLHVDHTGYLGDLTEARIVVQRRELQYAAAPHFPASMYSREDVGALAGPMFDRVDAVEGDWQLTDTVRLSWTGGHSPGHQQVEVALESGRAVICGDNVYLLDPGLTGQIPPGYVTSIEENARALARLRHDADYVLPSHDPAIHATYPDGLR